MVKWRISGFFFSEKALGRRYKYVSPKPAMEQVEKHQSILSANFRQNPANEVLQGQQVAVYLLFPSTFYPHKTSHSCLKKMTTFLCSPWKLLLSEKAPRGRSGSPSFPDPYASGKPHGFCWKAVGVTFGPLSHVKTHYTGCLIGILVVVYEIIPT